MASERSCRGCFQSCLTTFFGLFCNQHLWPVGCPVQGQESDSMIRVGPSSSRHSVVLRVLCLLRQTPPHSTSCSKAWVLRAKAVFPQLCSLLAFSHSCWVELPVVLCLNPSGAHLATFHLAIWSRLSPGAGPMCLGAPSDERSLKYKQGRDSQIVVALEGKEKPIKLNKKPNHQQQTVKWMKAFGRVQLVWSHRLQVLPQFWRFCFPYKL